MRYTRPVLVALIALMPLVCMPAVVAAVEDKTVINVGSKSFTESVVLGEIIRQLAQAEGLQSPHQAQLGGTRVLWNALLAGEIDVYAEYTGTLMQETLVAEKLTGLDDLEQALRARDLRMTAPLGFNNTYALGVKDDLAQQRDLHAISDLRQHPDLKLGFSSEFMDRADGWPGLQRRYQLPQQDVRGLDHDLAYRGVASGSLHVIDLYATDAEIEYYGLNVLQDDLNYFPAYHAIIVYRAELESRAPQVVRALQQLGGKIDAANMINMNAKVKLQGDSEAKVAREFLAATFNIDTAIQSESVWQRFFRHSREHLLLVLISLSAAIVVSVPLGIWAARQPRVGQLILGVVGIIQTIPSLALFVFMIPLLGIGGPPAVVALFLYSLLPIVRNTYAGLNDIPLHMRESAEALGLPSAERLRVIELPLATRSILAGIKTSAVINVGTAPLAALIGAGGYGQPILTGIRLDDTGLILQGAIPAAVLALAVQGLFEGLERYLLPRGLVGNAI